MKAIALLGLRGPISPNRGGIGGSGRRGSDRVTAGELLNKTKHIGLSVRCSEKIELEELEKLIILLWMPKNF